MLSNTKIFYVLFFIFSILALYKPPSDPDFGWHYMYGKQIVERGEIPRSNEFSYTFTDYHWVDSYWLSQAVLYTSHHNVGHVVSGMVFTLILTTVIFYYLKYFLNLAKPSLAEFFLGIIVLIPLLSITLVTVRPLYFSTIFLMLEILVLFSYRERNKLVLLFPIMFMFWANMHADFTQGLFIFSAFVIFETIRALREKSGGRNSISILWTVLALSFLSTLINPYGFDLWRTLVKEANPYQFKIIMEWVPLNFENKVNFIFHCFFIGFVFVGLFMGRAKMSLWYIFVTSCYLILSIRSVYFFRIVVILSVYALFAGHQDIFDTLSNALSKEVKDKLRLGSILLFAMMILISLSLFVTGISSSVNPRAFALQEMKPLNTLLYARENRLRGNVFNYYGWGGYMIWQFPEFKTFVDGRMPSWKEGDKSVFMDYVEISQKPEKNYYLLDEYKIQWILLPKDSDLGKYLKTRDEWKEAYSDDISEIILKGQ